MSETAIQAPSLRVLCVAAPGTDDWASALAALEAAGWGAFVVERCADSQSAARRLAEAPVDALVAALPSAHWPALAQAALNAAVVLVTESVDAERAARALGEGAQDVLTSAEAAQPALLARALRLGVERKRIEREARKAYATDLATGLPNHAQLIEHMSHLLALREREPAPMALLVLRLEGLATTEARLGRESANVLRRKVAVRLRAGVRASDVVASLGADGFAVLLSAIEEPAHAERVAEKLGRALQQPFNVAGMNVGVAVGVGCALYPADGKQADALLRRASGAAAVSTAVGRAGLADLREGSLPQAANDDDAS
jgi:diguanylate cyclase (GGDEF)-like protein